MRANVLLLVLVTTLAPAALGQKPWSEWDKKEVDKILNSSAWGQTQEWKPEKTPGAPAGDKPTNGGDAGRGPAGDSKYRIRLFSARPIREGLARMIILNNPQYKPTQLSDFVGEDYSNWIVVAITVESSDRRMLGMASQKFGSLTLDALKEAVYVERSDGKRLALAEYAKPSSDGTGAKFFFPKTTEDGKAWAREADTLTFVADMGGGAKISSKFKLSEMKYNGKIEY